MIFHALEVKNAENMFEALHVANVIRHAAIHHAGPGP